MKGDHEDGGEVVEAETEIQQEISGSRPIGELMSDSHDEFDLDARARGAAQQISSTESEATEAGAADDAEVARGDRTDFALRALLGVNVVVIGLMLALAGPVSSVPQSSVVADLAPPPKIGQLPSSVLWQQAVELAGDGEYGRAVAALEQYVQATPAMHDVERQLVYNQMAFYLIKDGRFTESQQYSLKSQQLVSRAYLPDDLIRGAAAAQKDGDLDGMRTAYARFLLQLQQASPALRQREAEALLKLGDSYRLSAGAPRD